MSIEEAYEQLAREFTAIVDDCGYSSNVFADYIHPALDSIQPISRHEARFLAEIQYLVDVEPDIGFSASYAKRLLDAALSWRRHAESSSRT